MSPCIRSVVTLSLTLAVVSVSRVSRTLHIKDFGLEDRLDVQNLYEVSLTRSKRQMFDIIHPGLHGRKEALRNNYRYTPDFWPRVPSPPPGPSLNDIIFHSSDGQYRGIARRYKGDAADLLATTQRHYDNDLTVPPTTDVPYLASTPPKTKYWKSNELLRLQQSRINRIKMMTTVTAAPRLTTPFYARFDFIDNVASGRRMMMSDDDDNININAKIPPKVLEFLRQKVRHNGSYEVEPWKYDPVKFAKADNWRLRTPITIPPDTDSPLNYFKYKYGTTTMRRSRTRRSKAKTTTTIKMMRSTDDKYVPQEIDDEYDDTTLRSSSQTPDKPRLDKKVLEDYIDDTTITNIRDLLIRNEPQKKPEPIKPKVEEDMPDELNYGPDATDIVPFKPKPLEIDLPISDNRRTEIDSEILDPKLLKELEHIEQSKTIAKDIIKNSGVNKFKTDVVPFKPKPLEIDLPISDNRKSENDSEILDPKLLKELEHIEQNKTIDKDIINNSGVNKFNEEFIKFLDPPKKKQTSRKQFEEINEDLKSLLMPDDEAAETPTQWSKHADYVDPDTDDIKGLPIPFQRRRRGKHAAQADVVFPQTGTTGDS